MARIKEERKGKIVTIKMHRNVKIYANVAKFWHDVIYTKFVTDDDLTYPTLWPLHTVVAIYISCSVGTLHVTHNYNIFPMTSMVGITSGKWSIIDNTQVVQCCPFDRSDQIEGSFTGNLFAHTADSTQLNSNRLIGPGYHKPMLHDSQTHMNMDRSHVTLCTRDYTALRIAIDIELVVTWRNVWISRFSFERSLLQYWLDTW